jgi:hypothetical protein
VTAMAAGWYSIAWMRNPCGKSGVTSIARITG